MGQLLKISSVIAAAAALSACALGPVDNRDRSAVARALIEEPVHDNDIVESDRSIAVPIIEQAVDGPFGGKRREPQTATTPATAPPADDTDDTP